VTRTPLSPGQQPAATPRAPRILVADDDRDFAQSLATLLRLAGYEARPVNSALEVRDSVLDFAPDVILLDIGMPRMSGYDVARSLRELYGSARPALVAVTGRVRDSDRMIARLAGFDHYVTKPYEPAALLELLEKILAHRAAKPTS
jgi:CheY-like chemotaxis protein